MMYRCLLLVSGLLTLGEARPTFNHSAIRNHTNAEYFNDPAFWEAAHNLTDDPAQGWLLNVLECAWASPNNFIYSQGGDRWEIINADVLCPGPGPSPLPTLTGDCSSWATWIYWVVFGPHSICNCDIVNGQNWQGGYTGTMLQNGHPTTLDGDCLGDSLEPGDLVIYGAPGSSGEHVAVYVAFGVVMGHGHNGLDEVPYNAMGMPIESCRRYA